MNLEAAWGLLRTNRLDVEHVETHERIPESPPGELWVSVKHRGYVARVCRCGEVFICDPQSDAVTCGGHRCG